MLYNITFAYMIAVLGENLTLNAFEIVLVGFFFVFFVLLVFAYTTLMLGKVFARMPTEESPEPVVAETATASEKSPVHPKTIMSDWDTEEDDPRYIAVVAAAIHCVMDGRKHRVVSIRSSNSSWAAEGRRQIFSSHNVR